MTSLTSINFELEPLYSVRQWFESIEIPGPKVARLLCNQSLLVVFCTGN